MGIETGLYEYLRERLPLILLFANGWLVYRLIVVAGLADAFVGMGMSRCQGSPRRLTLYILTTAALLSFFIPNAVTVLAMLPMLKTLDKEVARGGGSARVTTALTLSVIYGANIGGMGSLIGSPANLLLLGMLDFHGVPGREQISFFNWFIWSVPLVVVFCAAAWFIVAILLPPGTPGKRVIIVPGSERGLWKEFPNSKSGLFLLGFFLVFWIAHGILKEVAEGAAPYEAEACILYFILFLLLAFAAPLGARGEPLLRPRQIVADLPARGFLFIGLLVLIIGLARWLRIDEMLNGLFSTLIPKTASTHVIFLWVVLSVIILTEVFSNTVVSTVFFSIGYYTAVAGGFSPISLMIAVSAASTCAFMTPIATPCNALAYGEMKGVSLRWMLALGLLLNIVGALLMTAWLPLATSMLYG